jgi:hypothetical protein
MLRPVQTRQVRVLRINAFLPELDNTVIAPFPYRAQQQTTSAVMNASKTKPSLHIEVKLKSGDGKAQFTRLDKAGIRTPFLSAYSNSTPGQG